MKATSPIKASTQTFIEIEEIQDDVILMKDFSACTVVEVGAVNFYLLSQEEQEAIIYSYSNLLNSLSFPVQVSIISKRMNISLYLDYLKSKIDKQLNPSLNKQLQSYREFIMTIVKKTTVLEKRFFFVVPFSPLELGISGANTKGLKKEYVVSRAKTSLYPKRDNLIRLLAKAGLRGSVVHQQGLVELFYNLYNPSQTGRELAPINTYTDIVLSNSKNV